MKKQEEKKQEEKKEKKQEDKKQEEKKQEDKKQEEKKQEYKKQEDKKQEEKKQEDKKQEEKKQEEKKEKKQEEKKQEEKKEKKQEEKKEKKQEEKKEKKQEEKKQEDKKEKKHIYNLKINRIPHSQLKMKCFSRVTNLPKKVDLRYMFPPVYDQGMLGSCTANALCAVHEFETFDQKIDIGFKPSRIFLYYNTRLLINTIYEDSGGYLSDGIKSMRKYGVCSEKYCPYIIKNFTNKPSAQAYNEALQHKVIVASNIGQDLTSMKLSLYNKNPFVVGISIYSSFESPTVSKTGKIPMPKPNEQLLGGHAVVVCGYTEDSWIVRNSWGNNWGDKGYFYLPYLYLLDSSLSTDLWNISKIE